MEKRMTKAQALELTVKVVDKAIEDKTFIDTDLFDLIDIELLDKLQAMLAQQKKQDSAKRNKKGTSKVAKEKAENMNKVRTFFSEMTEQNALTLAEIGQAIGLVDATPQKLSAIMKPLVDNEEFEKTTKDKKVAYQVK